MNKNTLQIILFCFLTLTAYAQESEISVDPLFFHVDKTNHLIIINKDVNELNSSMTEPIASILSDNTKYTLTSALNKFEVGLAYEATTEEEEKYDLYFTQLPIINISTENTIVDEPRVNAHFSICESNGNYIEHGIGVEYKGASSLAYPKKSLRIEFWNDEEGTTTENISLLGMRSDDDWNLEAMYNEPLRLRSKVGNDLWPKIDELYYMSKEPDAINGIRLNYIELFVNNEYRGVYGLSERVDRKQLKLKKYKDGKIRGELYKGISWGASTFTALPEYNNTSDIWSGFNYRHPKEEINWENIYNFVDFVINKDSISFYKEYPNQFNIDNAVNYFIFLNLLRATDNKGKNLFIAKYGKNEPYFYVPWDLDGTFGMIWNGEQENTTNDILTNGFYERLLLDNRENGFLDKLKSRWRELRHDIITTENILDAFQQQYNYLDKNGVYEREVRRWPTPNFIDFNNLHYTSDWLNERLSYLDDTFNNLEIATNIEESKLDSKDIFNIYPNPASSYISINVANNNNVVKEIAIYDLLGQALSRTVNYYENKKVDISNLKDGVYIITVKFQDGLEGVKKLIIRK